jgi:hypothetical protein
VSVALLLEARTFFEAPEHLWRIGEEFVNQIGF